MAVGMYEAGSPLERGGSEHYRGSWSLTNTEYCSMSRLSIRLILLSSLIPPRMDRVRRTKDIHNWTRLFIFSLFALFEQFGTKTTILQTQQNNNPRGWLLYLDMDIDINDVRSLCSCSCGANKQCLSEFPNFAQYMATSGYRCEDYQFIYTWVRLPIIKLKIMEFLVVQLCLYSTVPHTCCPRALHTCHPHVQ